MLAPTMGSVPVAQISAQQAVGMGRVGVAQQPAIGTNHSVNYNISQLMNPADVNSAQLQRPQTQSINIDAFAGMS